MLNSFLKSTVEKLEEKVFKLISFIYNKRLNLLYRITIKSSIIAKVTWKIFRPYFRKKYKFMKNPRKF